MRRGLTVALAVLGALVLSACSSSTASPADAFIQAVKSGNADAAVEALPASAENAEFYAQELAGLKACQYTAADGQTYDDGTSELVFDAACADKEFTVSFYVDAEGKVLSVGTSGGN